MNQFAGYAKYYDAVYQTKPYKDEVNQIETFFKKHSNHPVKTILSLGCGTATYEIELAKRGYIITGVDLSEDMLKEAKEKIAKESVNDKISLVQGDIRNLQIEEEFDAVIMMFNIAGYLHTTSDLSAVVAGAKNHLKEGGIFLFDCWNETGVVADPPTDRTKIVEQDGKKITRVTKGALDKEKKLVKITFDVTEETNGKKTNNVVEEHPMRYFTLNEIKDSAASGGLTFVEATDFHDVTKNVEGKAWDMFIVMKK